MSANSVRAARRVGADPEAVFAFLSDLENHWELTADWVQVRSLNRTDDGHARGAHVQLRGPAGLRRSARTRLLELDTAAARRRHRGGRSAHARVGGLGPRARR